MAHTGDEKLSTNREVNWMLVVFTLQFYLSLIWLPQFILYESYLTTTFFSILLVALSVLGLSAGSHRLWTHHSYKASTSLKIFLMLCQTLSGHYSIYEWVRMHRLHHKYFRTELDPYNTTKGFLYSHVICDNLSFSPAQQKALKEIDMSDLEADKVVMFQKKYYWVLFVIITWLLPINAPVEYWGDSLLTATYVTGTLRFGIVHHLNVLIHTASTVFNLETDQNKSYDTNMVFFINKSYWLSYHQMCPWDYQVGEFGKYGTDCTSKFIRACAALELATDLQTMDSASVKEALAIATKDNKPIEDCLYALKDKVKLPEGHYLTPSKYYH